MKVKDLITDKNADGTDKYVYPVPDATEEIREELMEVTSVTQKRRGESAQEFTERVLKKVRGLDDKDWKTISELSQTWVNAVETAWEADKEIPLLLPEDGVKDEEGEAASAPEEPEAESDEESNEEKTMAKSNVVEKDEDVKPAKKAAVGKATERKPPGKAASDNAQKGVGRGRAARYVDGAKIKVLLKENPHREGTKRYGIFEKYRNGMTVGEAVKAGINAGDLVWAVKEGRIEIKG